MTRLDKVISEYEYILDALKALREIQNSSNCVTCSKLKSCEYKPQCGKLMRFNCPLYEGKDEVNKGRADNM